MQTLQKESFRGVFFKTTISVNILERKVPPTKVKHGLFSHLREKVRLFGEQIKRSACFHF